MNWVHPSFFFWFSMIYSYLLFEWMWWTCVWYSSILRNIEKRSFLQEQISTSFLRSRFRIIRVPGASISDSELEMVLFLPQSARCVNRVLEDQSLSRDMISSSFDSTVCAVVCRLPLDRFEIGAHSSEIQVDSVRNGNLVFMDACPRFSCFFFVRFLFLFFWISCLFFFYLNGNPFQLQGLCLFDNSNLFLSCTSLYSPIYFCFFWDAAEKILSTEESILSRIVSSMLTAGVQLVFNFGVVGSIAAE